jgi:hypothetical protein
MHRLVPQPHTPGSLSVALAVNAHVCLRQQYNAHASVRLPRAVVGLQAVGVIHAVLFPLEDIEALQAAYLWHNARESYKFWWHFYWDAFHPLKLARPSEARFILRQFERAAELQLHLRPPQPHGVRFGPKGFAPRSVQDGWRPRGWPEDVPGKVGLTQPQGFVGAEATAAASGGFNPVRDPVVGHDWEGEPWALVGRAV